MNDGESPDKKAVRGFSALTLAASTIPLVLEILIFIAQDGSAFGAISFLFFLSLITTPLVGFLAFTQVRDQQNKICQIAQKGLTGTVVFAVSLVLLLLFSQLFPGREFSYLFFVSITILAFVPLIALILINLTCYVALFFLKWNVEFILYTISQTLLIISFFCSLMMMNSIGKAC